MTDVTAREPAPRTLGSGRKVSPLALGAMLLGTAVDEATSYAILDRYVARGGNFIDTANNYAYWLTGSQGGESEQLLGRWSSDRGLNDEIVVATKVGGRPVRPTTGMSREVEGLAAATVREAVARSQDNLGRDRIDLLYAHIADPATSLEEEVITFGELIAEQQIESWGLSNHWAWQVERAATVAARTGHPACAALQYHYSYFRPRTDRPSLRSPDGQVGVASGDLLSRVRADPAAPLVAYSPLLGGAYVREDKPLDEIHQHPGNQARRTALARVAAETGATANQVVLSWLLGGDLPVIPLVGASSVAQLDELMDATSLTLTADQRTTLDEAG